MKILNRYKNIGFTLVEVGVFLLIVAAIVYGVVQLLGNKKEESYAIEDAQAIALMITRIQKIYSVGGSINSDVELIASNTLPKLWTVSGSTITHRNGGSILGVYSPQSYLPARQIHIHMANVGSSTYCITLASALAKNPSIGSIWAGNSVSDWIRVDFAALNYNTLTTSCNRSGTRRVIFNFKKIAP